MKTNPESILARIFGSRSPAVVDAMIESAPLKKWLAEVDSAEVTRRAGLLKQLHEVLPAKHEKTCADASKQAERAKKALEDAHAAVQTASQSYCEAYARAVALTCTYDLERSAIERELERSADARIWRFVGRTLDLFSEARLSDSKDRGAALDALNAAREAAKALVWQALTSAQVTNALERIRADLKQPLEAVNLQPPQINDSSSIETLH